MTAIYDNLCAKAYEIKNQVDKALESLRSQSELDTPDLEPADEALRSLNSLDNSIYSQLIADDGDKHVGTKLALALDRQQSQSPITEIPDAKEIAPTELNENNALEFLAPVLTAFDKLFALKVELINKFPNRAGNPFPGPDQILSHTALGVESVRISVQVLLEQVTEATREALLDAIKEKYDYGAAMVRDIKYFVENALAEDQ
ncbi:MAG: hypothetical protein OXU45_05965 [Candidatus Melainabacteria bacterium]|nr:hypothetical protein [Candidatus Melainabacteria bacterium]